MWKLWHRMFGWDYVRMTIGNETYIGRVRADPETGRRIIRLWGQEFDLATTTFHWEPLSTPPK
jgi:hypothetical protein